MPFAPYFHPGNDTPAALETALAGAGAAPDFEALEEKLRVLQAYVDELFGTFLPNSA